MVLALQTVVVRLQIGQDALRDGRAQGVLPAVRRALRAGHRVLPHRAQAQGLLGDADAPHRDGVVDRHLVRVRLEPSRRRGDGAARSRGRAPARREAVQVRGRRAGGQDAENNADGRGYLLRRLHAPLRGHEARLVPVRRVVVHLRGAATFPVRSRRVCVRRAAVRAARAAGVLVRAHPQGGHQGDHLRCRGGRALGRRGRGRRAEEEEVRRALTCTIF
mmetsp:Transcript_14480/g.62105  ORF Transcript_14480/g.62105 Transcript_14480/m.62105 type:complete len:219 (-) Transcript_14480:31-687(-)